MSSTNPVTISYESVDPASFDDDFFTSNIAHSLMRTYNDPGDLTDQSKGQFGPIRDRLFLPKRVFTAKEGSTLVGYAAIEYCSDKDGERSVRIDETGQRREGVPFWHHLDANIKNVLAPHMGRIAYISGLAVLDRYRGLGIGERLLQYMHLELNPKWVISQTKNPGMAILQTKVASLLGFRTALGKRDITVVEFPRNVFPLDPIFYPFNKMFLDAYGGDHNYELGIRYDSPQQINPAIPILTGDTDKYSAEIFKQFGILIKEQIKLGTSLTAMWPMISLSPDIVLQMLKLQINSNKETNY